MSQKRGPHHATTSLSQARQRPTGPGKRSTGPANDDFDLQTRSDEETADLLRIRIVELLTALLDLSGVRVEEPSCNRSVTPDRLLDIVVAGGQLRIALRGDLETWERLRRIPRDYEHGVITATELHNLVFDRIWRVRARCLKWVKRRTLAEKMVYRKEFRRIASLTTDEDLEKDGARREYFVRLSYSALEVIEAWLGGDASETAVEVRTELSETIDGLMEMRRLSVRSGQAFLASCEVVEILRIGGELNLSFIPEADVVRLDEIRRAIAQWRVGTITCRRLCQSLKRAVKLLKSVTRTWLNGVQKNLDDLCILGVGKTPDETRRGLVLKESLWQTRVEIECLVGKVESSTYEVTTGPLLQ